MEPGLAQAPIAVVVAADQDFAMQLATVIAGLSSTATRAHDVFVLHDGYDAELRQRVASAARDAVTIHWREIRPERLEGAILPDYLPPATLFRLQVTDLVPTEVERFVYLDLDIALCAPLDDLWETDLHGHVVAAVRDAVVPWAAAPQGLTWKALGVPPDTPYFNAGVLVVDAPAWRAQGIGESSIDLLVRHRVRYADQCALNAVLAGAWTPLAPRWNLQAGHLAGAGSLAWITEGLEALEAAIDDPAIVHFNASPFGRPWQTRSAHPRRDLWFEHLDRTAWAGWRPPVPVPPSRLRRLANRVRRAGDVLRGR